MNAIRIWSLQLVRGLLVLCIAIGLLAAWPVPGEALDWEWYVGAFVGGAFPMSDDIQVDRSLSETVTFSPFFSPLRFSETERTKARGATYDTSPVVGLKTGVCPSFFPYVCAEIDFDYFQPTLSAQRIAGTTQTTFTANGSTFGPFTSNTATLPSADIDVWDLGLNLIGRFGFLPEADFPLGRRLHLYLGGGPSVIWTRAKNVCTGFAGAPAEACGGNDTDTSVGVQALAGVRFFITRNLAVFAEYKFKHWASDFAFSSAADQAFSFGQAAQTAQTKISGLDFNIQMISVGLSLHFGGP
jgi:opacity protein-like surface antigen